MWIYLVSQFFLLWFLSVSRLYEYSKWTCMKRSLHLHERWEEKSSLCRTNRRVFLWWCGEREKNNQLMKALIIFTKWDKKCACVRVCVCVCVSVCMWMSDPKVFNRICIVFSVYFFFFFFLGWKRQKKSTTTKCWRVDRTKYIYTYTVMYARVCVRVFVSV